MKKVTINKSQISNKQNLEIYPCENGFKLVAGCKDFVCTHAQFIPVMVHYGNGEYEKALKILGVDVLKEVYTDNRAIDIAEENAKPKKRRGRPRKAKV